MVSIIFPSVPYLDILLKLNNQFNGHHSTANCTLGTKKCTYNHTPGMLKVLRKEIDFLNYRTKVKRK